MFWTGSLLCPFARIQGEPGASALTQCSEYYRATPSLELVGASTRYVRMEDVPREVRHDLEKLEEVPRDLENVSPPVKLDYEVVVRVFTHTSLVSSFSCLFMNVESRPYVSQCSPRLSLSLGYA